MGESKKPQETRPEEIIAAFDREREVAQELNRRHSEHVRTSRSEDRTVHIERRRRPR
jgi:hypothetical protein